MTRKTEIFYGKHFINKNDINEVVKSLKMKFITSGEYVLRFEDELKKKFNSKFAYTCSNATAGLDLVFDSIGIKSEDIILMPVVNFIAAYRAAYKFGAKIFLVDVDSQTGQMTSKNILECIVKNKIKKIKAIVSMYLGGYVENNLELYEIKKKFKCFLIEDACHAIGSKYRYKNKYYKIGSCAHSDVCVFSFHPVKNITTGEGGAVLTNNKNIAKNIFHLRSHGIIRKNNYYWNYDIPKLGYNYRLSDLNCALGLSQLKKIDSFFLKRKKIYNYYINKLKNYKELIFFPKAKNKNNFYHLFLIGFNFKKLKKNKNHLIKFLNKKGIFPQFHYKPINQFKFYRINKKNINDKFPGAKEYTRNFLSLPIYYSLSSYDQNKVISNIIEYINKYKK